MSKEENQELENFIQDGDKRLRIYGAAKSKLDVLSDKEVTLFGRWLNQCKARFDTPEVA